MALQVGSGRAQSLGIIAESAEAGIAVVAEQAANAPAVVAVIDRQDLHFSATNHRFCVATDGTYPALGIKELLVGFWHDAVGKAQVLLPQPCRPLLIGETIAPLAPVLAAPALQFLKRLASWVLDQVLDPIIVRIVRLWSEALRRARAVVVNPYDVVDRHSPSMPNVHIALHGLATCPDRMPVPGNCPYLNASLRGFAPPPKGERVIRVIIESLFDFFLSNHASHVGICCGGYKH